MKFGTSQQVVLLPLLQAASAFPAINWSVLGQQATDAVKNNGPASENPPFDAKSQLVSTSGFHEWRAPGPLDARGPCPGLNALANHAYLPRSGLASILDFVSGTAAGFGMGADLATILAVYGGALDGLGLGWSIGGGVRTGIGGSHGNYESDSSPLRGDLEQYGSNTDLIMSQFFRLYNMQPDAATANYDISVLRDFRRERYNESIAENPHFFYGPFSGATVTQAAFLFIYRFMANKTAEHPAGILNKEVLKSFMSIYGPEDDLQWVPGHERIPDNWYKRNDNDQYGLNPLGTDIGTLTEGHPEINLPGCNTGTVNSYQEIDIYAMTSGAYGPADVLANPLCFGLSVANSLAAQLSPVNLVASEVLLPVQSLLGCNTVPGLNQSAYEACPGASLYGGPTSAVAEGAIQN